MADNDKDLGQRGTENVVKGTAKDIVGKVKDAAGGLTGDLGLQAEGKIDQLKGKAQKKVGEIEQSVDRHIDREVSRAIERETEASDEEGEEIDRDIDREKKGDEIDR